MIAIETFKIYNTGVTLYSSFTYTASTGDVKTFDIPGNSSQYFYVSTTYWPVISPSPNVIVTSLGILNHTDFNFSSTTSSDSFTIFCAKSVFSSITINNTTYFEKIISENSSPETIVENTCFKLISTGSSLYDYYSTLGWNGYSCPPCSTTYCVSNTGLVGGDDVYITGGTYNGDTYWTGQTSGWTIYYSTGTTSQWCLSDTLGGTCYLTGKSPCSSSCPDLSSVYVFNGACPTPTPTPSKNCDVLDFTAIFDCDFIPTPTPTPSASLTPTPTITPSSTNFCSIIGINASGYTYTPTPTPTPTVTPTTYDENTFKRRPFYSTDIVRNCPVYGFANYSVITGQIICPGSQKFQDCYNGEFYYCSNVTGVPTGFEFEPFSIYRAIVNDNGVIEFKCISYIGIDYDYGNINTINITSGSYGYSFSGDCIYCQAELPLSMCFEYYSGYPNSFPYSYLCSSELQPSLYNGKYHWELGNTCPYLSPECDNTYFQFSFFVFWDNITSLWYFSDTLGGTSSNSTYGVLNNPGSNPIQVIGLYEWQLVGVNATCAPFMINSQLPPCEQTYYFPDRTGYGIWGSITNTYPPMEVTVWYSIQTVLNNTQPFPIGFIWTQLNTPLTIPQCDDSILFGNFNLLPGEYLYYQLRNVSGTIIYETKAQTVNMGGDACSYGTNSYTHYFVVSTEKVNKRIRLVNPSIFVSSP